MRIRERVLALLLAWLIFGQLFALLRWSWNVMVPFTRVTSVLSLIAIVVVGILSLLLGHGLVAYIKRLGRESL